MVVVEKNNRRRNQSRNRRVAFGGLLSSLALMFILLSSISPTADFALLTLSSLCIAVAVLEMGTTGAFMVYACVALIASVWPGIVFSYPFITFFGLFPIIKAFAEKRWLRFNAAIFKLALSAILISITGLIFLLPLIQNMANRYSVVFLPLLLLGALAIVLVYDYALSLLIIIYQRRRPSSGAD